MQESHRLVVVGGGIAGIDIATHLAGRRTTRGRLMITLVDRETAHVWKPMLHTIAAGTRDVYQQEMPYIAQARQRGFVFHPGEVIGIDRAVRRVRVAPWVTPRGQELLPANELPYDTLVLAAGCQANDFDTPGVSEHCLTIDSRTQAIAFNDEVRIRMLQAHIRNAPLEIGIVGGGATGVELAAELVRLAALGEYYGASGLSGKVRLTLLESGDRLLVAFPKRMSEAARVRLTSLGVTVRTGARVSAAEPAGFRLQDGSLVRAHLKVWAAGVKAADFLAALDGLELTRNHQVVVGPNLRSTRDPNVYAVGDCASLTPAGQQHPLPPTAQVAHQQARYITRHLPALLADGKVPNFEYRDFGSLVSLGGYGAFGSLGKFGFFKGGFIRGRVAQLSHALLYRSHQAGLYGPWRGGLLWLVDRVNARVRPAIRLD